MTTSLRENRKALAKSFKEVFGVSLRDCEEKPRVMECLLNRPTKAAQPNRSAGSFKDYGRGYPFMGEARSSASEADARNLEILSKW